MFYEVKIFNAKGELEKVLSPKKLSNRFWKNGEQNLIDFTEKESSTPNLGKKIWKSRNGINMYVISKRYYSDSFEILYETA